MLYSVGTISNFASASMMTCLTSRISRGLFSSTACFKTCYIAQELSLTWDKMLASVIFSGTCLRKLNMLMWSSHFKSSSSLLLKTARAKRNITWQKRTTQSANTETSHSDNAEGRGTTEGIAHHLWLGEGGKGGMVWRILVMSPSKLPDFFPPSRGSEVFLDPPSLAVNFL